MHATWVSIRQVKPPRKSAYSATSQRAAIGESPRSSSVHGGADFELECRVHRQYLHRRTACGSQPDDEVALKGEVFSADVLARVEVRDDLIAFIRDESRWRVSAWRSVAKPQ
jgi:hypothetical protein